MSNHPVFKLKGFNRWLIIRLIFAISAGLYFQSGWSQITIWPGDANNDGIVNNLDLLNIGRGFGKQGNPRDSISTIWKQEQVQPWSEVLPAGLNLGYSDCSGNGFVNVEDILAIEDNYNDTNGNFTGLNFLIGDPDDPGLSIIPHGSAFPAGHPSSVTIYLEQQESDSVYGIAFTFEYDSTIIQETTVNARPHPMFGGGGRVPVHVYKNYPNRASLEFAVSRTNEINHSGSIEVCIIDFVIEDNLIGKTFLDFTNAFWIRNIRLIDKQMNNIPVHGDTADAKIMTGLHDFPQIPFSIYPNPASGKLIIDNYENEKLTSVELIDLKGIVHILQPVSHPYSVIIDLRLLPQGLYVLRMITDDEVFHHKVLIER